MQQLEERNIYTSMDVPQVHCNCDPVLNVEETLSVLGLKTSSNNSDAALTGQRSTRTGLVSSCCKTSLLSTKNTTIVVNLRLLTQGGRFLEWSPLPP
jgi:hypothetical protein